MQISGPTVIIPRGVPTAELLAWPGSTDPDATNRSAALRSMGPGILYLQGDPGDWWRVWYDAASGTLDVQVLPLYRESEFAVFQHGLPGWSRITVQAGFTLGGLTTLAAANPDRKYIGVFRADTGGTAQRCYLGLGGTDPVATAGSELGIPLLNSGASWESFGPALYRGIVEGIGFGTTGRVTVIEGV